MRLKNYFLGLLLATSLIGSSQNLTGVWKGFLTQNQIVFEFELALNQTDSNNYELISKIEHDGETGFISGSGYLHDGKLYFEEVEIIETNSKVNEWCLKSGELNFHGLKLSGNWTGGCEGGTMDLKRVAKDLSSYQKLFKKASSGKVDFKQRQANKIFEGFTSDTIPGAIVVVLKGEKIVYQNAFGMANLEQKVPIDFSSVFDVGSMAKQFTGYLVAKLAHEGKFDLGDDIRNYIPELPDFGTVITIRDLLHHVSGLRDWLTTLGMKHLIYEDQILKDEILQMAFDQKALNFTPRSQFLYCNTGYVLLTELVARVTGKTFRESTDELIFQPLNMHHTHFYDNPLDLVKNRANGYRMVNRSYQNVRNNLGAIGSSSLQTTMEDYIKWSNYLLDQIDREGSPVYQMVQDTYAINEKVAYGYGLTVTSYKGLKKVYHFGRWTAFNSSSIYFPEQGYSFLIFSNKEDFAHFEFSEKLIQIYLGEQLKTESEASPQQSFHGFQPSEIVGTYFNIDMGRQMKVFKENDTLKVNLCWLDKTFPVVKQKDGSYVRIVQDGVNISFEFDQLENGQTQKMKVFQSNYTIWDRMESEDSILAPLTDYEGRYYSEELSTYYEIFVQDGILIKHERLGDFKLEPTGKDFFLGLEDAWMFRKVVFQRGENAQVIGLEISNAWSWSVVFRKI